MYLKKVYAITLFFVYLFCERFIEELRKQQNTGTDEKETRIYP